MTLDHTFLSHHQSQSKSLNTNQAKIYGSNDSSKEIYRSTEESSATITQDCEGTFNQNSNKDSMYDQDLKSDDKDDKCPFIYVIKAEDNDSWAQLRNVHQNNGFDEDSDEPSKSRAKERMDCCYESIVNEEFIRKEGSRESDQATSS